MKASEFIEKLKLAMEEHGDLHLGFYDSGCGGNWEAIDVIELQEEKGDIMYSCDLLRVSIDGKYTNLHKFFEIREDR